MIVKLELEPLEKGGLSIIVELLGENDHKNNLVIREILILNVHLSSNASYFALVGG